MSLYHRKLTLSTKNRPDISERLLVELYFIKKGKAIPNILYHSLFTLSTREEKSNPKAAFFWSLYISSSQKGEMS